jgi:hypothetical protein
MNKQQAGSLKARAEAKGIPYKTVYIRVKRGWSEEEALNTPLGKVEPKIKVEKPVTVENVARVVKRGEMRDAFEAVYGCKFVPGPQGPPWVNRKMEKQ